MKTLILQFYNCRHIVPQLPNETKQTRSSDKIQFNKYFSSEHVHAIVDVTSDNCVPGFSRGHFENDLCKLLQRISPLKYILNTFTINSATSTEISFVISPLYHFNILFCFVDSTHIDRIYGNITTELTDESI